MTFERPPRRISTALVRPTGGAAERTTSRIAVSSSPASPRPDRGPADGSGLRRHETGSGQVADDRPNRLLVTARPDVGGEFADGDVVAAVQPRPAEPFGHPFEHARIEARALDEEHVKALVALLG